MGTMSFQPRRSGKINLSSNFFKIRLSLFPRNSIVLENRHHSLVSVTVEVILHAGSRAVAPLKNAIRSAEPAAEPELDPVAVFRLLFIAVIRLVGAMRSLLQGGPSLAPYC